MKDKVSIIIPVYKAEKTLKRCVDSILDNQYENLELILIEDCSPDQSWEVCRQYADKNACIRAVRNKENKGVSNTRNHGLALAKGTYVMFVDSDDWVEKDYISRLADAVKQCSTGLAISGYVNHDELHAGRTDQFGWGEEETIRKKEDVSSDLKMLYEQRLLQQLWNKIFLKSIIEDNHIRFDENINVGEDFRFVLKYIESMNRPSVVFLNLPLYHYIRDNAESLMSKVGYERLEEGLSNMEQMYRLMRMGEQEIKDLMKREKEEQQKVYAYIIMHNSNMTDQEKKRLIKNLAGDAWQQIYREQKKLYCKEKIVRFMKKWRKSGH